MLHLVNLPRASVLPVAAHMQHTVGTRARPGCQMRLYSSVRAGHRPPSSMDSGHTEGPNVSDTQATVAGASSGHRKMVVGECAGAGAASRRGRGEDHGDDCSYPAPAGQDYGRGYRCSWYPRAPHAPLGPLHHKNRGR